MQQTWPYMLLGNISIQNGKFPIVFYERNTSILQNQMFPITGFDYVHLSSTD